VLALCSYVTGMEMPGLRSLFTRIELTFHEVSEPVPQLWYRARTLRFDSHFRMLDTELQVVTPAGALVARRSCAATFRSAPPRSISIDWGTVSRRLPPVFSGKAALVLGGTRGLGAEIAASLALAGCHVYASARHAESAFEDLRSRLAARGADLQFVAGDAGDAAWCDATLDAIRARHGGLDVLVLNACAPPPALRAGRQSAARRERYVRENLQLIETPLDACADSLAERRGVVAYVSSSFVDESPAGFGHYVAVKQAGEGLVRTLVHERSSLAALVARPPALQTRWNDTPRALSARSRPTGQRRIS
jgi:NAD(P)-dependent dehydrogenase (short-subunit alcohol dehydrogenase family)